MNRLIRLADVQRRYGEDGDDGGTVGLAGVTIDIERGEHVAIVGPSGSGKSTLLNIIGCLDRPSSGTYELDGIDLSACSERHLVRARRERIGFVFQAFHLLAYRTVLENVAMPAVYRSTPRGAARRCAMEALESVGLAALSDADPRHLSGGERQRVAIARALAGSPRLLLCDEPTGNLDSTNTAAVLDLFDALHDQGLTIVVVTHEDQVSERASRVVTIDDGRIGHDTAQPNVAPIAVGASA